MRALWLILLAGCGAAEAVTEPGLGEGEDSTLLDSAPKPESKTDDQPVSCGAGSCPRRLCGFQTPAGAVPSLACFALDGSSQAYVRFSVSGAESVSADSRTHAFVPRWSLENVLFYGVDLWLFSTERNGFEVVYRDVIQGAFLVGEPYQHGPQLSVYTRDFKGPGSYTADGEFSGGDSFDGKTRTGKRYAAAGGCQLSVSAGSPDGVTGTFSCSLAAADGARVSVSGEFRAAGTALNGPIIIAK